MSRTHKSKNYLYGAKRLYKGARVRQERARLREAIGNLRFSYPLTDEGPCACCGGTDSYIAADAGPTEELAYFNHYEYD